MNTKKEYIFLIVVLLSAVFVLFKTYNPTPKLTIKAIVTSQNDALHSIYQQRSVRKSKTLYIDTLAFASGRTLSHSIYGQTAFKNNFFIDATASFTTTKKQRYYFDVFSDDGFLLKIDDKKVCEFEGDRAYKKSRCHADLYPGEHNLKLSYFQGGGPLGLTLFFSSHYDKKWRTFGKNSEYLTVKEIFPN